MGDERAILPEFPEQGMAIRIGSSAGSPRKHTVRPGEFALRELCGIEVL
jgi:hypothetical protein